MASRRRVSWPSSHSNRAITEITLRVYPLPEAISAAICSFPSLADAVNTVIEVIQLGVPIARVELVDGHTVRMVNRHSKLTLREEPMLLLEFHGSAAAVKEQAELVQALASNHNGQAFEWRYPLDVSPILNGTVTWTYVPSPLLR